MIPSHGLVSETSLLIIAISLIKNQKAVDPIVWIFRLSRNRVRNCKTENIISYASSSLFLEGIGLRQPIPPFSGPTSLARQVTRNHFKLDESIIDTCPSRHHLRTYSPANLVSNARHYKSPQDCLVVFRADMNLVHKLRLTRP